MNGKLARLAPIVILMVLAGCKGLTQGSSDNNGGSNTDIHLSINGVSLNTDSQTGANTGVHMVFSNTGTSSAANLAFQVVLSASSTDTGSAKVLYQGSTGLGPNTNQPFDLTYTQIASYLSGAGSSQAPADGQYYVGVILNSSSTTPTVGWEGSAPLRWYINQTFPLFVVQGYLHILSAKKIHPAPGFLSAELGNGAYSVFVGALPSNSPLMSNGSTSSNQQPSQIFGAGWKLLSGSTGVAYSDPAAQGLFNGGNNDPSFTIGIPYSGNWALCAVIDANNDGAISFDGGAHFLDAAGVEKNFGTPESGLPVAHGFSGNLTNLEIDFGS